jgi:hypothetical protein
MKNMSVQEYTLYRKWEEINQRNWSKDELQRIWEVQNQIWRPKSPEDFEKLDPQVVHVNDKFTSLTWLVLRVFTHTMPWKINVGRIQRFYVINKSDYTFLGIISVASDFVSLKGRDAEIGWSYDQRIKQKMLNYTAMGSTIAPTNPLGYNFVGGKLIALLTVSDFVEDTWNKKYKEPVVGITTTSLYGGYSQYTRLKYWKKCASTEGKIPLEPSDEVYLQIREWVKEKYPDDFNELTLNEDKILSRPKSRMLFFAYRKLGIKAPENDFSRGVYWCPLYKNTNAFLRQEKKDLGKKNFDNSVKSLTKLWKEKYARKRVDNLVKSDRYNLDTLYYNGMIGMSWDEAKEKYLGDVGR